MFCDNYELTAVKFRKNSFNEHAQVSAVVRLDRFGWARVTFPLSCQHASGHNNNVRVFPTILHGIEVVAVLQVYWGNTDVSSCPPHRPPRNELKAKFQGRLLHRIAGMQCIDAAICYRCRTSVCLSVLWRTHG